MLLHSKITASTINILCCYFPNFYGFFNVQVFDPFIIHSPPSCMGYTERVTHAISNVSITHFPEG